MPGQQTIQYYDRNAAEYAEVSRSQRMSKAVQLFVDRLTPAARVLDLGCGAGWNSTNDG